MKNNRILPFIAGAILMLLLVFFFRKCSKISEEKMSNDYYVLTNQITKMNKMVVMEQDFSTLQKTKVKHEILGNQISENEIVTFTKTNAQVTYDLNKMKLEVDSANRKLIILELPEPQIKITSSPEIQSIDDSFFNRINENQIKKVTEAAKTQAIKKVDQRKLREEGRKQLMLNLNTIFVLAKALKFDIVDETQSLNLSEL